MTLLKWAFLALAACVTGIVATRPVILWVMESQAVRYGPWQTSAGAGSADANLYERAAVAIAGLYALAKEETLYYTAFRDSAGALLDGRCEYTLTGRGLPARWWSLTMYGADHYLVENPAGIHSRHAGNLELESDGGYVVHIAAARKARNWLPAPAARGFSVTLRLYNPEPAVYRDLATIALPALTRGTCS